MEREFAKLLEEARKHLDPKWEFAEVIVLKTAKGNIYTLEIPDVQDSTVRTPLEDQCIRALAEQNDIQIIACLATIDGLHPEIPSWNFRSKLVSLDAKNLDTCTFLWGGGSCIHCKPFRSLLPPEKK